MTKSILVASLSAIALMGAAPALAQSANGSANSSGTNAGGANADDPRAMTCAQLSAYDTATVPGVLYFLSGVQAGQKMNGAANSANSNANASGSGDAMKSADAGQSSDAMADSKANTDKALKSADASDQNATSKADNAANGQSPTVEIGRLSGYFTIPVQQLITACATDPNKNVAQLLDEQSRNAAANADQDEVTGSISSSVEPSKVDQLLPLVYAENTPDLSNADVKNAKIVGLSSLESSDSSNANLDQTISSRNSDKLMAQINGNDALKARIQDQGYKADDVLAVMKRDDGQVVVYVDDRNS